MSYYADSSFLVSCYLLDTITPLAKAYLSGIRAPLLWTALHALEIRNAFELGTFRGLLTTAEVASAWANLESDLRSGRLIPASVRWPTALRRAARLSERFTATKGTRSLGVLHIAAAKSAHALEFITFDGRQRALASAVGFRVAP